MKHKLLITTILFLLLTSCTSPNQKPLDTEESSMFQTEEVKNCKVLDDSVEVKSGAGQNFDSIGKLNKDQIVNVLGTVGDWYVVQLDNNNVGCIDSTKTKPVVKEPNQAQTTPDNAPDRTPPDQTVPGEEPAQQPQEQPEQNNTETPNQVTTLSSQEQQMVNLVNDARAKNDLPPLTADLEVARVARIKSQDMVDNDYFSHYSPNHGSPFDMMKSFGIEYLHAGENLAGNSTVETAHEALMNSSGHRKNILSPDFTHIGIGVKPSGTYGYLYTQMFISKPK